MSDDRDIARFDEAMDVLRDIRGLLTEVRDLLKVQTVTVAHNHVHKCPIVGLNLHVAGKPCVCECGWTSTDGVTWKPPSAPHAVHVCIKTPHADEELCVCDCGWTWVDSKHKPAAT